MIVVSGTPGTGKTTIARILSKRLELPLIETNPLVRKKKLYTKKDKGSLVVNLSKLKKEFKNFKGIAEGHVLCEFSLPATIIVLRASPRSIKRRLSSRLYPRQKLLDNIEAEAIDYCSIRARQNYKKVIEIDTTGLTPSQSATKIINYLEKNRSDSIDWSDYFLKKKS